MSVILCTAGYDHTIRFWEALSGFCSRQIPHPESQINRLCISPNKAFVAAAGHFTVKLYSCKGNDPSPIQTFEGHTNNITGLGFHCDTKWMVTSSEDGTVKIWDIKTGTVQRNYNHGCPVNDVVIHPNQGELISCDRGGNVRIWDLGENKCSHQLIPEDDVSVASVTVASDGSLLCAGNNTGNVYVWRMIQTHDTTSLVPVCKFAAHNTYITRVLLSPDVRHLATCSADHTARIWAVDTSAAFLASGLNGPASPVEDAEFDLPEGGDGADDVDDEDDDDLEDEDDEGDDDDEAGEGQPLALRNRHAGSTGLNLNRSPSLQHTHAANPAAIGPGFTGLHSPPPSPRPRPQSNLNNNLSTTPNAASTNTNTNSAPPPFAANTNGTTAGASREAAAFPLETTLTGHQRWVWDCAFSADSAYLVTACSDHYARLWELSSESIIRQYNGHHRGAVCVALNDYSEVR